MFMGKDSRVLNTNNNVLQRRLFIALAFFVLISQLSAFDTGKNPVKAMVFSGVIPGGGQFYNESYYKAAGVLALEGYFIGNLAYNIYQANYYKEEMKKTIGDEYYFNLEQYNLYFNRRQNDVWWLGTVVFLSIVDAYVDASLFNYEQEKESVYLLFENTRIGVGIRW